MPYYADLMTSDDPRQTEADLRTAERLLRLKARLDDEIPQRTLDNLLVATWNIREFDASAYGRRTREAFLYLAEIISRFDVVAIQEVREELVAMELLKHFLGGWWRYLVTDVTEGKPGNRERTAFLYDSRKISFGGFAGEVVLPPIPKKGGGYVAADQLVRTPYIVGFRSGWFAFTICTTHILYGSADAELPQRVEELRALAEFLAARAKEKHAWAPNMITLGDFNIFKPEDKTMQALLDAGFYVPEAIRQAPANAAKTKHYDQIAFITPDLDDQLESCRAGAFDYYQTVYRDEDEEVYAEDMGEAYLKTSSGTKRDASKRSTYYKSYWRTHQMSDHLPLWIELQTDFSRRYLKEKLAGKTPVEDMAPSMINL